jgi:hypothetical protein
MNKQCKECNKQFEATNTKGSEQLYCSKICRNKSANKRFQLNLINKYNDENKSTNEKRSPGINGSSEQDNGYSLSNAQRFEQARNPKTYDSDIITSIKETYEERSKSLFYQLKCEQLEKEVQELKQDIINLEMELDECNVENDEDNNGIISGLMTSFKQDPQNTISFATELITNFIKPKKTA